MSTQFKFNPFTHKLDLVGTGGSGGGGIMTINTISPDGGGNFTIESTGGSISLTPVANGIDLAVVGGSSLVSTLSGNDNVDVSPVAGNINLLGIGGNYLFNSAAGQISANNLRWLTPYIVDQSTTPGSNAEYQTIQDAINAAGAAGGGDVYVRSNTNPYTENLTLIGGVNIIAVGPDGRLAPYGGADAIIVGNHTFTGSGAIAIKGIYLNNTSGTILTQSNTTGISLVGFIECQIVSNGDFVHVSSTGVAAIASLLDTNLESNGQVAVVGVGGTFSTIGTQMQGFSGTAISNSGNIALRTSTVTAATNCIEMLTTGSSAGFDYCQFGGTIGVLFTAAGGANSDNCTWDCTDGGGFYIAGAAGNYTYDNDNIYGSATAIAPGITQQKAAWRPRAQAIAAPSTGGDYGTCAFDSAAFTVTDGFVQLIGGGGVAASKFGVDASTGPGTNPVLPDATGLVTITGGTAAQGTVANIIQTDSLAVNQYTIQVQISDAVAASDVTQNGVSHFDSASFTVDANGFVQLASSGTYISLSPYIVGQAGDTHAGFTTISAAIAQAVTDGASAAQPANIYIKPGTYTESPTMVDGINLIGMMSNSRTVGLGFLSLPNITSAPDVLIAGTLTYAPTSASVDTNASITNVVVSPTAANTPAIFLNPNTGGTAQDYITLNNVVGQGNGTGAGLHDSTASIGSSAGNVSLDNCYFSSYVDDTVGLITGRNCFILGASTVSFTSNATFQNCNFNGSYLHSSTNGPSVFTDCQFSSSVAALPGSSIEIYNCTLSTPITSGGCSYGGLTSFGPLTVTTGDNSMHSQWGDTILSQVRASGNQTLTALTSYYGNVGTGIATITLPTTNVGNGQVFIIKDEAGNATTNNLTVNVAGGALIDGAASQVISVNYGVLRVIFTGTNYFTW